MVSPVPPMLPIIAVDISVSSASAFFIFMSVIADLSDSSFALAACTATLRALTRFW